MCGGGGGLQNDIIACLKLFAHPPPPQLKTVKIFAPPFQRVETFYTHPSVWLKLHIPALKLLQNLLYLLQHGYNFYHPPPPFFFVGVKRHLRPPPPFSYPPPPPPVPVIELMTNSFQIGFGASSLVSSRSGK